MEKPNCKEPDSTSRTEQQRKEAGPASRQQASTEAQALDNGREQDQYAAMSSCEGDEHHHVVEEYVWKTSCLTDESCERRERMIYSWREVCSKMSDSRQPPWQSLSQERERESPDHSQCVEHCIEEEYKTTTVRVRGL